MVLRDDGSLDETLPMLVALRSTVTGIVGSKTEELRRWGALAEVLASFPLISAETMNAGHLCSVQVGVSPAADASLKHFLATRFRGLAWARLKAQDSASLSAWDPSQGRGRCDLALVVNLPGAVAGIGSVMSVLARGAGMVVEARLPLEPASLLPLLGAFEKVWVCRSTSADPRSTRVYIVAARFCLDDSGAPQPPPREDVESFEQSVAAASVFHRELAAALRSRAVPAAPEMPPPPLTTRKKDELGARYLARFSIQRIPADVLAHILDVRDSVRDSAAGGPPRDPAPATPATSATPATLAPSSGLSGSEAAVAAHAPPAGAVADGDSAAGGVCSNPSGSTATDAPTANAGSAVLLGVAASNKRGSLTPLAPISPSPRKKRLALDLSLMTSSRESEGPEMPSPGPLQQPPATPRGGGSGSGPGAGAPLAAAGGGGGSSRLHAPSVSSISSREGSRVGGVGSLDSELYEAETPPFITLLGSGEAFAPSRGPGVVALAPEGVLSIDRQVTSPALISASVSRPHELCDEAAMSSLTEARLRLGHLRAAAGGLARAVFFGAALSSLHHRSWLMTVELEKTCSLVGPLLARVGQLSVLDAFDGRGACTSALAHLAAGRVAGAIVSTRPDRRGMVPQAALDAVAGAAGGGGGGGGGGGPLLSEPDGVDFGRLAAVEALVKRLSTTADLPSMNLAMLNALPRTRDSFEVGVETQRKACLVGLVLAAVSLLSADASVVLRCEEPHSRFAGSLLFLLYRSSSRFTITKCLFDDPSSPARVCICTGFRPSALLTEHLKYCLAYLESGRDILEVVPWGDVDQRFQGFLKKRNNILAKKEALALAYLGDADQGGAEAAAAAEAGVKAKASASLMAMLK
jgi:hypothetical protein